jgi:hypothetical protein
MSATLSLAELDAQHVELLPARTVLSVLAPMTGGNVNCNGLGNCNHIHNNFHNNIHNTTTTNTAFAKSINVSPVTQVAANVSVLNTGNLVQAIGQNASTSSTAIANAGK